MAQAKTWAAFDVHVSGVVAAVLERDSGELWVRRLPGRSDDVAAFAAGLPGPVRATYEGGPSAFVLAAPAGSGRCRFVGSGARVDSRAGRVIGSRPIVVTPSEWCGCWPRVSCIASRCRALSRRRCAT